MGKDDGYDIQQHEHEQRVSCKTCVSHLQHKQQIETLTTQVNKDENIMGEMWADIKKKVPWGIFLTVMTVTVTLIIGVSTINFMIMIKVLSTGQDTNLSMVAVQKDVETLGKRMDMYEKWIDKNNREHEKLDESLKASHREIEKMIDQLPKN